MEGQLAEAKETQIQLELEKSEVAEQLATVQEELRIALFDLERLKNAPSLDQLLAEMKNPEFLADLRIALSRIVAQPPSAPV